VLEFREGMRFKPWLCNWEWVREEKAVVEELRPLKVDIPLPEVEQSTTMCFHNFNMSIFEMDVGIKIFFLG